MMVAAQQPLLLEGIRIEEAVSLREACKRGSKEEVQKLLEQIDPNLEDQNSRPIHWVAESGNVHALAALLEDPRIQVNKVKTNQRTALHLAACKGNHEVLNLLLNTTRIDINAVDNNGRTAFHLAAEMPVEEEGTEERFLLCLTLLMDRPELQVNKPDFYGRTAIARALRKQNKQRILTILKHQGNHKLNLDYCIVDGGKTIRESIKETFPKFELPEKLLEDIKSEKEEIRLLAALQHDDYEEFKTILKNLSMPIERHYDEPYHCTCLELACIMRSGINYIKRIIEKMSDCDIKNKVSNIPVLHITAERLNIHALQALLESGKFNIAVEGFKKGTVLHWLALNKCDGDEVYPDLKRCVSLLLNKAPKLIEKEDVRKDTPLHVAVRWENIRLALILLASEAPVDTYNNNSHTPLHVAALSGNKDTTLSLLKYGANINAQKDKATPSPLYVAAQRRKDDIALLLLKQGANFLYETQGEMTLQYIEPQILKMFFDDCIESNGKSPKRPDYELRFKYNFIPPVTNNNPTSNSMTEMHTLLKMGEMPEMKHLLKHPLISSVLSLKWGQACSVFYANIVLYLIFLLLLTFQIIFINTSVKLMDNEVTNNTENVEKPSSDKLRSVPFMEVYPVLSNTVLVFLVIFLFLIILREVFQATFQKWKYLNLRNLLDVCIIVFTLLCTFPFSKCVTQHISSIGILLAWIEFFLLIGCLPVISVKLEMLKKVSSTFLTYGFCYLPLFFAFAFSFNVLFTGKHRDDEKDFSTEGIMKLFANVILYVFEIFIMFTGEFEANELPFSSTPVTSHILFFIFVFLVALALLNLLNGLAVSDTQAIKDDAETVSHIARAKLVLQTETMFLHYQNNKYVKKYCSQFCFFFRDLPYKKLFIYPNDNNKVFMLPPGKVIREVIQTLDSPITKEAIKIVLNKTSVSQTGE